MQAKFTGLWIISITVFLMLGFQVVEYDSMLTVPRKPASSRVLSRLKAFLSPLKISVSCQKNCHFTKFTSSLKTQISEGDEISFLVSFPGLGQVPKIYLDKYPELLKSVETLEGNRLKITLLPSREMAHKRRGGKYIIKDKLVFYYKQVTSSDSDVLRTKRINLKIEMQGQDRRPDIDAPDEVVAQGAQGKVLVTIKGLDKDDDNLELKCESVRYHREVIVDVTTRAKWRGQYVGSIEGTISINDDTLCSVRSLSPDVTTSKIIHVKHENKAPAFEMSEEYQVRQGDKIELQARDADGDQLEYSCLVLGKNICHGKMLDSSLLPGKGKFDIQIRCSDGLASDTRKLSIWVTALQVKELHFSIPQTLDLDYPLESLQGAQVLEIKKESGESSKLPSVDLALSLIHITSDVADGRFSLSFKKGDNDFFKLFINVSRLSWPQNQDAIRSIEIVKDVTATVDDASSSYKFYALSGIQGVGKAYVLQSGTLQLLGTGSAIMIQEVKNQIALGIDWSKVADENQTLQLFITQQTSQGVSSAVLSLKVYSSPALFERPVIKLSQAEYKQVKLNFKSLSGLTPQMAKVNIGHSKVVIFKDKVDPKNPEIKVRDNSLEFYMHVNRDPGVVHLPIDVIYNSGSTEKTLRTYLQIEVSKTQGKQFHLALLAPVGLDGKGVFPADQIVAGLREAQKQFLGLFYVVVDEYKWISFSQGAIVYDDSLQDERNRSLHDIEREKISKKYTTALPIYYFKELIADDGKRIGGLGSLPSYRTQEHFALISQASDKSTLSHEIGHNLGLYHTFAANKNPQVELCYEVTDDAGEKYCNKVGIYGNIVLPKSDVDSYLHRQLPGDGISDTAVDGHGVHHFKNYCYTDETDTGEYASRYNCPKRGVSIGNAMREEGATVSSSGLAPCKLTYRYGEGQILDCDFEFVDDRVDTSVKTNSMSYWDQGDNGHFSVGQKAKIQTVLDESRLRPSTYLTP